MKRIAKLLMLSCEKAAQMVEKEQDVGLNPVEKAQLLLHTSVCKRCARWQQQSKHLDQALTKAAGKNAPSEQRLSEEAKKAIINKVEQLGNDGNA